MNNLNINESRLQVGKLGKCPDCEHLISHRAESCPSCGFFIQNLRGKTVDERGWVSRIAWGVIIGYFGILFINIIVGVFAFMLFAGLIASAVQKTATPNYTNPSYR